MAMGKKFIAHFALGQLFFLFLWVLSANPRLYWLHDGNGLRLCPNGTAQAGGVSKMRYELQKKRAKFL